MEQLLNKFKLSHYRHSGRYMHHRHSSWGLLVGLIVFCGGLMAAFSLAVSVPASQLEVRATVAAPLPVGAPVIDYPGQNQVFDTIPIQVSGRCEDDFLVQVFRNDIFGGSTVCADGAFSLTMDLFIGRNTLTAQHANIFNQIGPVSAPVTVYYEPPVPLPAEVRQLVITSPLTYHGVIAKHELILPLEILGGTAPYAVSINWGDGTTALISRERRGEFEALKKYNRPGSYIVNIRAADAHDQTASLQFTAIVHGEPAAAAPTRPDDRLRLVLWPIIVLCFLLVMMFWAGERYELRYLDEHGWLRPEPSE